MYGKIKDFQRWIDQRKVSKDQMVLSKVVIFTYSAWERN